jgi:hypothetical protein
MYIPMSYNPDIVIPNYGNVVLTSPAYTGYGTGGATLNNILAAYNSNNCSSNNPKVAPCSLIIQDMSAIYTQITGSVSGTSVDANTALRKQIHENQYRTHAGTGLLATQKSDYMSVVMSSVIWTTLAGAVVVFIAMKK